MDVIGKVIVIGQTETVGSAGTFKKRLIVVETAEQYPQMIPVDFVQDKCGILDKYKVGDEVTIGVNMKGNEYKGKYYISLNGWKISKSDDPTSAVDKYSEPEPSDELSF